MQQDLRHAVRILTASPGFTAVAVLSLALGIGANTAIFSLLNSVLMSRLPVRNPHELVMLTDPRRSGVGDRGADKGNAPLPTYQEFRLLQDAAPASRPLMASTSSSLRAPRPVSSGDEPGGDFHPPGVGGLLCDARRACARRTDV